MDDQKAISITQALNHIQSWFNAGEYDQVIQGCAEIMEMEPGNQRALALMKMAEEQRHSKSISSSTPFQTPQPTPEPFKPAEDPLANLQVEESKPEFRQPEPIQESSPSRPYAESIDKRQLFFAMLIPAVIVVLLGGSLIWYLANRDRSDTIANNSGSSVSSITKDTTYLDENEERVKEMTAMAEVIENYRQDKGKYPDAADLERILVESDDFSKIPVDPKQGDLDAEGKPFGYMYAIYDSKFGKSNQYYILSALFEDSQGVGYEWNVGESVKNYDDYRDISQDHVTFIGSSK